MSKRILYMIILIMMFFVIAGCGKIDRQNNNAGGGKNIEPTKLAEVSVKPTVESTPTPTPTPSPTPEGDPITAQINKMTLDEKIGQMVMSGVDGYTISNTTIKLIKDYHVGGLIILGENVKTANQLLGLVNSLKGANSGSDIPLFLSIDQEGGRIDRMPPIIKRLPSNKAIGEVNNPEFSYKIGGIIAEQLSLFGLNMDFAPVMDINSNPKNPIIGDRSFGNNPDIVSRLGIQTMKGIRDGKIIPAVKHFPGHGDTSVDSHVGLPSVNNDMKRLKSFELIPFAEAIKNKVDVVMAAHILLPRIDSMYPSSMSKAIITDILRVDLNFDGVVITDDMTMGAITKNYNIGDAAVKSVNAGSDIVLVCHVYDNEVAVINALKKAVQNGTISKERVNKSVYRILKLKQKYKISDRKINSINVNNTNSKITNLLGTYMK